MHWDHRGVASLTPVAVVQSLHLRVCNNPDGAIGSVGGGVILEAERRRSPFADTTAVFTSEVGEGILRC